MKSKPLMIVTLTHAVEEKVENEGAVVQRTCSSFLLAHKMRLWDGSLSVRLLTLSNMAISATGKPNFILLAGN